MRRDDNPCETLAAAGRHLLEIGGMDILIIDGKTVLITARVVEKDELIEAVALLAKEKRDEPTAD